MGGFKGSFVKIRLLATEILLILSLYGRGEWVQKKFCPKKFLSTKIEAPKKLGPKSLVKIRPVRAEILLIFSLCGGGGVYAKSF